MVVGHRDDASDRPLAGRSLASDQNSDSPLLGTATLASSLGLRNDAKGHGHLGGLLSGKLGANRFEVRRVWATFSR